MNLENVFNDAAARDSVVTAPQIGQTCVLLSTGDFLVYYGSAGWCAPWNLPWGEVAQVEIDASVAIADTVAWGVDKSTIVGGMEIDPFVPVANRRYEIVFDGETNSNGNGDLIDIRLVLRPHDSSFATVEMGATTDTNMAAIAPFLIRFVWRFGGTVGSSLDQSPAPAADSVLVGGRPYSVGVSAGNVTGSDGIIGADRNYHSSLVINDIGPIGPPVTG